jgi:hypothetical protein
LPFKEKRQMRLKLLLSYVTLWVLVFVIAGPSMVAQQSGSTLASPATFPHDMTNYGCAHYDDKSCDQAPAPPPDYNPLIGTWIRFSLLRNGFTVQPPDAPLYLKMSSDGYWSMMEFHAGRPKINKPLEQQTPQELYSRFADMDGGWGNYSNDGQSNIRHHLGNIAAPGNGGAEHVREWVFERNILLLVGTGANRSPQARFRKLPNQPLASKRLAGTWERLSLSINGTPVEQTEPEHLILGEDGWFQQTLLPPNRIRVRKPMEQWTTADYVSAYRGMSASRGTYNANENTLIRKHIADADPNLEDRDETGQYTLQGDVMSIQGTDAAGRKFEAKYQRMKPYDVYAPWSPSTPAGR